MDRQKIDMLLKAAGQYLEDAKFLAETSLNQADKAVHGLVYTVGLLEKEWEGEHE